MQRILSITTAIALSLCASLAASAANFGYCTDNVQRNNLFRVGSTEKQGLAIKLSHEKAQLLKGCTIDGIRAAFGSSRTTDNAVDIFVATSLTGEPATATTATITSAVKWLYLAFDTPYVITGDEEAIYIGYTANINTTASLLMGDFTADAEDLCMAYKDGEWVDICGYGYGNALIKANIGGAPAFTDLMLKPISLYGYFRANNAYQWNAQIYNFGAQEVKSFDMSVTVGDEAPVVIAREGLNIAQGQTYDIALPQCTSAYSGDKAIKIQLTNINGEADADATDNVLARTVFFYPEAMERSILLEGFTGQACSNCPTGHSTINEFMESHTSTPVIEVMHHAGYQPDYMTMATDYDCTYFYGKSSTYAPAVMINRMQVPSIGEVPVMNTSASNLAAAYAIAEEREPYVSLSLETAYDADTRDLSIKFRSYAHRDMPAGQYVFNVFLVQNDIISKQTPYGNGYQHDAVFRGALTGNSWGVFLPESATTAKGEAAWEKAYSLPEEIFADYYYPADMSDADIARHTFATDPANMYLVAYVAEYGSDVTSHAVCNAIAVPLGESHVQGGLASAPQILAPAADIAIKVVDGRIVADGNCEALQVFNLDGSQAPANAPLRKGIYIARATAQGTTVVKKVIVR